MSRDIPDAAKHLYEKIDSLNGEAISYKLALKMEAWVTELVERIDTLEDLYADERITGGH